jgi:hypothetical protein
LKLLLWQRCGNTWVPSGRSCAFQVRRQPPTAVLSSCALATKLWTDSSQHPLPVSTQAGLPLGAVSGACCWATGLYASGLPVPRSWSFLPSLLFYQTPFKKQPLSPLPLISVSPLTFVILVMLKLLTCLFLNVLLPSFLFCVSFSPSVS